MPKKARTKSELYIWSLVLLCIALLITALHFLSGDAFGFTSAMIALGGMGLGMSDRWKNAESSFHISIIIASLLVIATIIIFHLLFSKTDNNNLISYEHA